MGRIRAESHRHMHMRELGIGWCSLRLSTRTDTPVIPRLSRPLGWRASKIVGWDSHAVAAAITAIAAALILPAGAIGRNPCGVVNMNSNVGCGEGLVTAALRGVPCATAAVILRQTSPIVYHSLAAGKIARNGLDTGRGSGGCDGE